MNKLNNKKIVFISGANKGIGKYIAKSFLNNKYYIIGTSRTKNGCNKINNYLKKNGIGLILNLNKNDNIKYFIKKIILKYGNPDILINNAGIIKNNFIQNMSDKEWDSIIQINLTSIFLISKAIIPGMIKKKYGRIINIGSIIGSIGNIGQINYSASKSGLIGLTKSLAKEVARYNITVNIVSPGYIKTNMTKSLIKKKYKKIISTIPIKRLGKPKEIAYIVKFLASNKSEYITGETIHVNGGLYMS